MSSGERYSVPTCRCGHAVGEHKSGRSSWPHPMVYGICLVEGCDCTSFVELPKGPTASAEGERTAGITSATGPTTSGSILGAVRRGAPESDVDAQIDALSRAATTPWPPEAA